MVSAWLQSSSRKVSTVACFTIKTPSLTNTHQSETSLALGGKVIAAAGTQEKMDVCMKYGGADYAVDYTKPNWQKDVMEITKGKGVDVVYDPVGRIRGLSLAFLLHSI